MEEELGSLPTMDTGGSAESVSELPVPRSESPAANQAKSDSDIAACDSENVIGDVKKTNDVDFTGDSSKITVDNSASQSADCAEASELAKNDESKITDESAVDGKSDDKPSNPKTESKHGKDEEIGIDDEMEAIFGESLGDSGAVSGAQEAMGGGDSKDENKSEPAGSRPSDSPDDSNLEVMMEKLHEEKLSSPLSKPKASESASIRDVLQALTEDDPSDPKKTEKPKKSGPKPCPKSEKNKNYESESEVKGRTTRSKLSVQSSGKKKVNPDESSESDGEKEENTRSLRKRRPDSTNQATSSNAKRKLVKEEDNSESEDETSKEQQKDGSVKRPRGRPRKNPLPSNKESEEKGKVDKVIKKKAEVESSEDEDKEKPARPKRGRGRPKRKQDEDEKQGKRAVRTEKNDDEEEEDSSEDESTAKTPRRGRPKRSNDDSGSETSVPKGLRPTRKSRTSESESTSSKANLVSRSNKVCVVADCRQHCLPSLGISLHRFPMPNNPMRIHWLALIKETPPGPNTAYMCSKHFKEDDYTYDETKSPSETFYRKLKPLAFPTIGLPVDKKMIDEVRARVAEIIAGKDPKDVTRSFLKEVKKKIKVEDEPKSKTVDADREDSRSPSPKVSLIDPTPTKTPAPKKKMDYETKRTPGTNCSVPCCGNNLFETRAEGLNISYYRFPFDDALAARWIKKIGDPDLVARTARICSDHFLDKDFEGTLGGKRNLKPKAVPSQFLTNRKPRDRDRDHEPESGEEESDEERYVRKKAKSEPKKPKKPKPDTSFITMPLPIIEDVDIKSEPASDNEVAGQDYTPMDPEDEETVEPPAEKTEKRKGKDGDEGLQDEEPAEVKRGPGRPKKDAKPAEDPPRKIVTFGGLTLPVINVERLGQRVIDAAESGSLRVRIKESAEANKAKPKSAPQTKRKLPESDSDSPPKPRTRPGPLCKKQKLIVPKEAVVKKARSQKILKMSDYESSESDVDDPKVRDETGVASTSFAKSPNPIKVKLAELPSFLRDRAKDVNLDEAMDITSEELDAIINSDKSEKDKIIKLVEQRISEHTKIIEGKSMGAQELADHNKILQGSALVLKKLAEKSGKPLTASQVMSLNVQDSSAGRTIVLKKVPDPGKLGLKPPRTLSSPTSPLRPPTAIVTPQSSPARALKEDLLSDDSKTPQTALEKIRDYDNLMKKYLSAVLDKNVMSKKYTESKDAQKLLENKLAEKVKECENLKRKAASLNAKMNRINTALEYFLTPNQIKLALQETKKVAWTPEEMLTAYTIKHLSKACYLFLRHKLNYPLPGISSLQRWMTMLSKEKTGEDDDDNIADEDLSDKEEGQEILVEGPGVVNEISGTLEEINAGGVPGEEDEYVAEENVQEAKDSNQSSPFQVVFENEGDTNRKVIILKKMPNSSGKLKMKSKLQISASKNEVGNMEESENRNELYKLLPGAKTISMATSPATSAQKRKVLVTKTIQEKEKITFQRLPQVRKEVQKPPTIQVVKSEPQDELHQFTGIDGNVDESMQMELSEMDANETIVKPEDVSHRDPDDLEQHEQHGATEQKYFSLSDLSSTQMEEQVVENVEHTTEESEGAQQTEQHEDEAQQKEADKEVDESNQVTHQVIHQGAAGLEELVQLATSGEQQITFATSEDLARAGQFAQIAYQGPQGEITYAQAQGEITLPEDINNMTAVVINEIDDDQLNALLASNVVEEKSDQTGQFGQKKIVYQTVGNQKNVIVLPPDTQAFMEEDEGTNPGAPRVYIINDEGHIVSSGHEHPPRGREISIVGPSGLPQRFAGPSGPSRRFLGPSGPPPQQEIGFIDSSSFAELGLKLPEPETFSIGNLIQNYAINSPTRSHRK